MSLYSEYFYSKQINEMFSDERVIAQMLRFESALAVSQAKNGIFSKEIAEKITKYCKSELINIDKLKSEINLSGNAAIPLIKQLTQIVKNNDVEASKYVHLGATSQDVIDTATVLQIKDFLDWLNSKLKQLSQLLFNLTTKHRQTYMVGRTLLQQAKPITFGFKTASWLECIERSIERINQTQKRILIIQLGGAVGTGNSNLSKAVQASFAKSLDLQNSDSWHSNRDNLAELAAVLGILNQSIGKIAKDISLLMQTEIGEIFEGAAEGKGGSSTMPHKRNPVNCTAILANSTRIPQLVATMLSTMPQEHERSAGLWHAEWEVLTEIIKLTAGSLEKGIELIQDLEIDEKKMLQNLELTNGLIYAENISLHLAQKIGKAQAHELVEKACKSAISEGKHLKEVLIESGINENLDELFKPENSIGNALEIIDSILSNFSNVE